MGNITPKIASQAHLIPAIIPTAHCDADLDDFSAEPLVETSVLPTIGVPKNPELTKRLLQQITTQHFTDGLSIQVQKVHSLNLLSLFNMMFGTTALGPNRSTNYDMGVMLNFQEDGMLRASFNPSTLQTTGQWVTHPHPLVDFSGQYQLTAEGNVLVTNFEMNDGESALANLDITAQQQGTEVQTVVSTSFLQAMHPTVDVGITNTLRMPKSEGGLGGVVRYHKDDYEMLGMLSTHQLYCAYDRVIEEDELKVVTEMEMDLSSLSGQAAIGAQFKLVQGTLTTSIDSDGTCRTTIERKIDQGSRFSVGGEANPFANHYKFSIGLELAN
jgi:hypothetical protein